MALPAKGAVISERIENASPLTLAGDTYQVLTISESGGAIYNSGTLTIGDRALFQDNISLGQGTTLGHGSDIYNDRGIVVIGDNLTIERTSIPAGHDCAIYSPNGGDVTIGNNAKFTGIKEAVVVGGGTHEIGARYLLAKQDAYFDGLQRVASNDTDVLTGVVGVKYKISVQAKDWTFKPTLRLAATYDLHSSDSTAHVTLPGGSGYQIVGERLKRFGVETGVGLETTLKDWTVGLEYTGNFRKDYQSHTGMLKAKYSF